MSSCTGKSNTRVLALALSGIGNFLMQSPALELLKQAHPDWHVTVWLAPRGTRELAASSPFIDDYIEASPKRSPWQHMSLISHFRKKKFDVGIILSPSQLLKSAAYLYAAHIPKRIGHTYPLFGHETSFLLTDTIPENHNLHDIEQNLSLLKILDIDYNLSAKPRRTRRTGGQPIPPSGGTPRRGGVAIYNLTIPPRHHKQAEALLTRLRVFPDKKLIGFHPGSASHFLWKRWPLKNFAEIGRDLIAKRNAHILIFGGPNEAQLKQDLQRQLGQNATVIPHSSLLTTAAIMQHCQLFLSNDSGLMHLAAASKVPTYGIFGPTDEIKTGPRGSRSHVIRAAGTKPIYITEKRHSLGPEPHASLTALSPAEVLSRLLHRNSHVDWQ